MHADMRVGTRRAIPGLERPLRRLEVDVDAKVDLEDRKDRPIRFEEQLTAVAEGRRREDGALRVHKVSSTPAAPERAILAGIAALGGPGALGIVHGSTVDTDALLEGKSARTAFVTNRGFADLLLIGRQARRDLYDLAPLPQSPPVPPELCLETGGRLGADGRSVDPLTAADLARLGAELARLAPEAVAVDLLFAFLDGRAETRIAAAAPAGAFVALLHEVLPVPR